MTTLEQTALKLAAALWVIWGLVHMLAGVLIIPADATSGFQAIADAVTPETLALEYPAAVGGVLKQHGWNLFWAARSPSFARSSFGAET